MTTRHRFGRISTVLTIAVLALMGSVGAAEGADDASGAATGSVESPVAEAVFDPTDPIQILRPLVFPVVGTSSFSPTFGACRDGCTRLHEGVDIMTYGWKGVPVVAAHDGVVTWAHVGGELAGCGIIITATDGWSTVYTHLNTDLPGTDVNEAPCFAPGITVGTVLAAGTVIGWVGDAGNAEETPPHLHFEVRHPSGVAVDPWVSLVAAERIDHHWIDATDLATVAKAMHTEARTIYVVSVDVLASLANADTAQATYDAPVIPYDANDPGAVLDAVRDYGPERIILFTGDSSSEFISGLVTAAPIVAIVRVGEEADEVETSGIAPADAAILPTPIVENPEVPVTVHAPIENETIVILATKGSLPGQVSQNLDGFPVIVVSGRSGNVDAGVSVTGKPDDNANRNGLWWLTADGWRMTNSMEDRPLQPMAYVTSPDARPWTLAFLTSSASAPPMPLWHHQPTSFATISR
ncbi:MAG TPA: M23 family metallopeptidase [Acidimicrobiia bacterium]|nr:M23 family metallopeptidase [Acidimicrobiia bacterium]